MRLNKNQKVAMAILITVNNVCLFIIAISAIMKIYTGKPQLPEEWISIIGLYVINMISYHLLED